MAAVALLVVLPTPVGAQSPSTQSPSTPSPLTQSPSTQSPVPGSRLTAAQAAELQRQIGENGARAGGGTRPITTTAAAASTARAGASTAQPAAFQPPGVAGIDVSKWDGNVDWAAMSARGVLFAYVKATEGVTYTSPYYASQTAGASQYGIVRGAYHFALPPASSGAVQARFLYDNGGKWSRDGKTMPPMLDLEYNPYPALGNHCYNMTPAELTAWIKDFTDTYTALIGRRVTIYTSTSWWNDCVRSNAFGAFPLHVPWYQTTAPTNLPMGWTKWHIWQYMDERGPFGADSNVWHGTYEELVTWSRLVASIDPFGPPATPLPALMSPGRSVASPNGKFVLVAQGDGNMVIYDVLGRPVWSSNTFSSSLQLATQSDGNLVLYDENGRPRWYTGTSAPGGSIVLQDDGNLVIRQSSGRAVWDRLGYTTAAAYRIPTPVPSLNSGASVRSLNGQYTLVMQGDGNLVLYQWGQPVWHSQTFMFPGSVSRSQSDGNLVIYQHSQARWHTGTQGLSGAQPVLQDDGNLVIYHSTGAVWDAKGILGRPGIRVG